MSIASDPMLFSLAHCGVVHTHQNKRLAGTSRAENHMTRCAIQDVYELHQHSQIPAMHCQPLVSDPQAHKTGAKSKGRDTVQ